MPGPPGAQLGGITLASEKPLEVSLELASVPPAEASVAASAGPDVPPLGAPALASSASPDDAFPLVPVLPTGVAPEPPRVVPAVGPPAAPDDATPVAPEPLVEIVPEPLALTVPAAPPLPVLAMIPPARPPHAAIANRANALDDGRHGARITYCTLKRYLQMGIHPLSGSF